MEAVLRALSCARLLAEHGLEVTIYGKMPPPKTPILVLNNVTYDLIKTIWRENYLFEGSYIVSERRLLVGKENEESIIKQSSTIIGSDILTKRLLYSLMKTYDTIKVESRTKKSVFRKGNR